MIRKVRNCCETCENLVCVATTIGQLQHTEDLKPMFLDTFKWAIRPVFPETVTYIYIFKFYSSLLKAFQVDLKACLGLVLPNQYCLIIVSEH